MPKKEKTSLTTIDDMQRTTYMLQIHEGLMQGKSVNQLADELGLNPSAIRTLQKDVTSTLVEGFHDQLLNSKAIAYHRINRLYQIVESASMGRLISDPDAEDADEGKKIPLADRRHWIALALKLIEAQVKLFQSDREWVAEREKEGVQLNHTEIKQVTIVAGDEMYAVMQALEAQRWANTDLEQALLHAEDAPILQGKFAPFGDTPDQIVLELERIQHGLQNSPDYDPNYVEENDGDDEENL